MHDAFNEREGVPSVFASDPTPLVQPELRHRTMASSGPSRGSNADIPPHSPPSMHMRAHEGVVAQRHQNWWEWLVNVAIFPLRFMLSAATDLLHFVSK